MTHNANDAILKCVGPTKIKIRHVLLTWEELPESISYYLIPHNLISKDDMKMLLACHNNWIGANSVDTSRAKRKDIDLYLCRLYNTLSSASLKMPEQVRERQAENCGLTMEEFNNLIGKWESCKIKTSDPSDIPASKMFRSGYML